MILFDRPRALSKSNSEGDVQSSTAKVSELSGDPSGFPRCWVRAPSLYFLICCSYKILSEQVDDIVSRWVCAGRATYITLKWIKERCRSCGGISTKAIPFCVISSPQDDRRTVRCKTQLRKSWVRDTTCAR